jgi:putative DNA methylase
MNADEEEEEDAPKGKVASGFALEYDAARKIAQGLGAHLESLTHVVEVKGAKARLLPVSERTKYLFGKEVESAVPRKRKPKVVQTSFFEEVESVAEDERGWSDFGETRIGSTALDRVHQAMLFFAAGRTEALKRFLTEEGVGKDVQFWKLAQALSALYPTGTDEKRWVDGVLARKKGLGFG